MTVKDVKRIELGNIYRESLFVSIIFIILTTIVLHFLAPNFNLLKLPAGLNLDELLILVVMMIVFGHLFFLYIVIYRFSVSWRIQCPVTEIRNSGLVQSNLKKIVKEIKQKLMLRYNLLETEKNDKFDRFFLPSDSNKLVCDDQFVIYLNGKMTRLGIIRLQIVLRKLSSSKEEIDEIDEQIEEIINKFEPSR